MGEPKFKSGQMVRVIQPYGRGVPDDLQVVRVGRSLVYVKQYGRDLGFYIENGSERRPANGGGIGAQLYTMEEWAEREERTDIVRRLKAHDIRASGGGFRQDTATLRALVAVLDAALEDKS